MTREQLDLLIRYINAKVQQANPALRGTQASHRLTDELVGLIAKLEESAP